jgi:hypothetical protein
MPTSFEVFSVTVTDWLICVMQTCVSCAAGNNPRTWDLMSCWPRVT